MKKIYYGWFVALACFVFVFLMGGLVNASSSLYVKPIIADLGFSRGAFTLTQSILSFAAMLGSLFFGVIINKLGIKKITLLGLIAGVSGVFLFSVASQLYVFYIASFLIGIGFICTTSVPVAYLINNWFIKGKGVIIGVVFASTGLGGMIFNPLVGQWIAALGWRNAYRITGLILLLTIPVWLLIRSKPSDMGLVPYGAEKNDTANEMKKESSGVTLSEAKGKGSFWLFCLAVFFIGAAVQPIYVNASAYLSDAGFSEALIPNIIGLMFLVAAVAKVLLGYVNDKFGIKPVVFIGGMGLIISALVLINTHSAAMAIIFAVTYGISFINMSILLPLATAAIFGQKDYASFLGIFHAILTLGIVVGIPVVGFSFDYFQNYNFAFIGAAVLMLVALILIFLVINLRKSKKSREEAM